ncbi:hypothetical protein P4O66_018529 [Electrophorus voltai]|uniref:Uncharacterized protein n=1 Tax=Electrophorus voltai TaxID=2609070 RepID=A0AAD8YPU9_9TELE|nr:hypothetical protein P4O66_018529 [Electrophorus voltai]
MASAGGSGPPDISPFSGGLWLPQAWEGEALYESGFVGFCGIYTRQHQQCGQGSGMAWDGVGLTPDDDKKTFSDSENFMNTGNISKSSGSRRKTEGTSDGGRQSELALAERGAVGVQALEGWGFAGLCEGFKKWIHLSCTKEQHRESLQPPWYNVCSYSAPWRWGSVMLNMLPHGHQHGCQAIVEEPEDDREERILAVLGIIGTVLNLLVVIFVYIYTTI